MPISAIALLSLCDGVLLDFGAPGQLRLLAGLEHGRTIPLPDLAPNSEQFSPPQGPAGMAVEESAQKVGSD